MAKTLLEKMFLKPEYASTFLHVPEELHSELQTKSKKESVLNGTYKFILTFYTKKADVENEALKLKEALSQGVSFLLQVALLVLLILLTVVADFLLEEVVLVHAFET